MKTHLDPLGCVAGGRVYQLLVQGKRTMKNCVAIALCAGVLGFMVGCGSWTSKDGMKFTSYWSLMTPTVTVVENIEGGEYETMLFAGTSIFGQGSNIAAQAVRRPNKTNVSTVNSNSNNAESDQYQGQDQDQYQGQDQDQYQGQEQDQYQGQDQDQDQEQTNGEDDDSDSDCFGC